MWFNILTNIEHQSALINLDKTSIGIENHSTVNNTGIHGLYRVPLGD